MERKPKLALQIKVFPSSTNRTLPIWFLHPNEAGVILAHTVATNRMDFLFLQLKPKSDWWHLT
jgi:hypothetical protein